MVWRNGSTSGRFARANDRPWWIGQCRPRAALQAKLFNDPEEPEVFLTPAPGVALEVAREHLADRIWRLHHSGACYGLKIQAISLAPSRGVRHRDAFWKRWRRHGHQRHASSLAWARLPLLLQCIALNGLRPTWPTWALVLCPVQVAGEPAALRPAACRLLQLVSTGLLAAQLQGLLASVLQVLSVLLALAGLLGHELAGVLSLRFLQRSLQLLAAALPLALVLFLFVPRLPPLDHRVGSCPRRFWSVLELDPLSIVGSWRWWMARQRGFCYRMLNSSTDAYWRALVQEQFYGCRGSHDLRSSGWVG